MRPFAPTVLLLLACHRDRDARRRAGFRIRASRGRHRLRAAGGDARSRRARPAHLSRGRSRSLSVEPRDAADGDRRPGCGARHAPHVAGAAAERARLTAGRSRRRLRHLRASAGDRSDGERLVRERLQPGIQRDVESPRRSRRVRARRLVRRADGAAARDPPARARRAARHERRSRWRKRSSSSGRGSRSRRIAVSTAWYDRSLPKTSRRRYVIEEVAIPVAHGRDDHGDVGSSAQRDRRRRAADAARVHARSIEPRRARGRGPRLCQRARARAHRGRPDVSPARAVRVRRRRRARRHRVDRQRSRGATAASACKASGYGGFVAWSAAKRPPPALQAIATSDPMAPGIDVPQPQRNLPELRLSMGLRHSGSAAATQSTTTMLAGASSTRTGTARGAAIASFRHCRVGSARSSGAG